MDRIRSGVGQLGRRMTPPPVAVLEMIVGAWLSQAIYVAAQLKIADEMASGPKEVSALAKAVGAHEESLFRLLRALAQYGILKHHAGNKFSLTPLGNCLRSDVPQSVRGMALFVGGASHWNHWKDLLHSVKTGQPAVDKIEGMGFFDWLTRNPQEAAIFDQAMTSASEATNGPVAAAYDFSQFKEIIDVGGGHGSLIATILKACPKLKGVIYDLPHTREGANRLLENEKLLDRCRLESGNFFEKIPSGFDAYILKNIIHDWPENECLHILKNLRAAVPENSKLLLIEAVIPAGSTPHIGKLIDLEMLLSVGGKERTRSQYRELLEKGGFKLTAVFPTVAPVSIIEARPR